MITIGSLFSGIGGLELGLERALDAQTAWQVEKDEYCRRVLARHWPLADRSVTDARKAGAKTLQPVDVLCGGFPCQDVSTASHGAGGGIDGQHTGLWTQLTRCVTELGPRGVVVENVDGAAARQWVPVLRRSLHRRGYASLPLRVRASAVGAPHRGSRIFLVATPYRDGQPVSAVHAQAPELPSAAGSLRADWGRPSPRALGVADGVPDRTHRLRALGNAVVPQCAYVVGLYLRELLTPQQQDQQ